MTLYETLGVEPTANEEEIQRAYRKRAAEFHPDNLNTADENRFHDVCQAKEVLTDPEKRSLYDATGIIAGQDTIEEQAFILIAQTAGTVIPAAPTGNIPAMIADKLYQMLDADRQIVKLAKQGADNIEKRWKGAERIKKFLLANIESVVNQKNLQAKVYERAIDMLREVNYEILSDPRYMKISETTMFGSLGAIGSGFFIKDIK